MQPLATTTPIDTAKRTSFGSRLARNVAVQDGMVVADFTILLCAVLVGKGPEWIASLETVMVDLAIFVTAVLLVRGEVLKPESYLASVIYRAGIFGPAFLSYFQLRWILPAVTQRTLDADI